jgi:hypothetical protein
VNRQITILPTLGNSDTPFHDFVTELSKGNIQTKELIFRLSDAPEKYLRWKYEALKIKIFKVSNCITQDSAFQLRDKLIKFGLSYDGEDKVEKELPVTHLLVFFK